MIELDGSFNAVMVKKFGKRPVNFGLQSIEQIQKRIGCNNLHCLDCGGKGFRFAFVNTGLDSSKHYTSFVTCHRCKGIGHVTFAQLQRMVSGKQRRAWRTDLGVTLRQASFMFGISPAGLSRIESGD
jgi:hypothetical protein